MSSNVWFITGAGRGLGLDIAKAALEAGHQVVATGRDTGKVALKPITSKVIPYKPAENVGWNDGFKWWRYRRIACCLGFSGFSGSLSSATDPRNSSPHSDWDRKAAE